jgi:hypothetical protein
MAKHKVDTYHEVRSTSRGGKKKLSHIEVRPAKNEGHTVTHHYHPSDTAFHQPDVYAFGEGPETVHHLMDHLGVKENEMISHLQGMDEEFDTEEPGGKPDHEEADKEPKYKHYKSTRSEERGED